MSVDDLPSVGEPVQLRGVWAVVLLVPIALFALVGVLAMTAGDSGSDTVWSTGSVATAPLDLGSVSAEVAQRYEQAAVHRDAFEVIPCYCGCESFLDHRNLYDCFVRPDGSGWEAHAAGCGVCLAEGEAAQELLEQGGTAQGVRTAIIARFASTAGTVPSRR